MNNVYIDTFFEMSTAMYEEILQLGKICGKWNLERFLIISFIIIKIEKITAAAAGLLWCFPWLCMTVGAHVALQMLPLLCIMIVNKYLDWYMDFYPTIIIPVVKCHHYMTKALDSYQSVIMHLLNASIKTYILIHIFLLLSSLLLFPNPVHIFYTSIQVNWDNWDS